MKHQWLDRTLLRSPIPFALATDKKTYEKLMGDLNVPEHKRSEWLEATNAGTTHVFDNGTGALSSVITILPQKDGVAVAAVIAHEAMHLWRHIREYIGEHSPSKEMEAYAIENLTHTLMEEYKRQTTRKRGGK